MAKVTALGLSKIEVADITATDGKPGAYAALGLTYQDTCQMTEEDPTTTEHYAEEVEDPIITLSRRGKLTFAFSLMNANADTMQKVFGGTVAAKKWTAPAKMPVIEKAVKITPEIGGIFEIGRASLTAKMNGNFNKSGIFLIDITLTVLNPEFATIPRVSYTDPA